jgi:hypothetical protein
VKSIIYVIHITHTHTSLQAYIKHTHTSLQAYIKHTHTSLQAYIMLRVGLNFLNTYKKI